MGDQCRPILRVLGAILVAHRHADHERHLEQPGRHCLPLRGLVEDLVTGAAQKVAVHQLDDRSTPGQGVADACAYDPGLGNRGVEQPPVRQQLGQTTVDGERAAPIAVLLTPGRHRRVSGEAVRHRLEQPVAELVHLQLGHRLAVGVERGADLFGDGLNPGIVLQGLGQLSRTLGGRRTGTGERHGLDELAGCPRAALLVSRQAQDLSELGVYRGPDRLDVRRAQDLLGHELFGIGGDGVGRLPHLDLFL